MVGEKSRPVNAWLLKTEFSNHAWREERQAATGQQQGAKVQALEGNALPSLCPEYRGLYSPLFGCDQVADSQINVSPARQPGRSCKALQQDGRPVDETGRCDLPSGIA
jgi:hypothetical protein